MDKPKAPRTLFREDVRRVLKALEPGDNAEIALWGQDNACSRRVSYQDVNMVAYTLWGSGRYRMVCAKGAAVVTVHYLPAPAKYEPPVVDAWARFEREYRDFITSHPRGA